MLNFERFVNTGSPLCLEKSNCGCHPGKAGGLPIIFSLALPHEKKLLGDLRIVLPILAAASCNKDYSSWISTYQVLKNKLQNYDTTLPGKIVRKVSSLIPDSTIITTDVGQNQVWVAQSFHVKKSQTILFSGGHGAMGYSLPDAIGATYTLGKPVYCMTGDGGLQMNIQELQTIAHDSLPIHIILLNNHSLGMIRHFQEIYFNSNYTHIIPGRGYDTPDFCAVATAYGIPAQRLVPDSLLAQKLTKTFANPGPSFTEIVLSDPMYGFPKLGMNRPLHDQDPLLDRNYLHSLLNEDFS